MDNNNLTRAFDMMQSSETADHNDAYILFRNAGEEGCSFLIEALSNADDSLKILIVSFLKRMLVLDELAQDKILDAIFAIVNSNPSMALRLAALEAILTYLTFSENQNITNFLLSVLLNETDFNLMSRISRYLGKNRIKAAIPYLEVLATNAEPNIATLAAETLEEIALPYGYTVLTDWHLGEKDASSLAEQI